MSKRFGYLTSGEGRLLQTVINASARHNLPFTLAAVVAAQPNGAAERAQRGGITTAIVEKSAYPSREAWETAMLKVLDDADVDALILNFDWLLGAQFLRRYPQRILNMHFSLLPLFPGFGALDKVVQSDMRFAGATVHLVDETVDGGPIVAQVVASKAPDMQAESLGRRLFMLAAPMQLQAMSWLAQDRIRVQEGRVNISGARFDNALCSPNLEPPFDDMPELYEHVF